MTIKEAMNMDTSGFTRTLPEQPPLRGSAENPLIPERSIFIRCPLPNIPGSVVNPDSLRALYQGGAFPQTRAFNPAVSQNPSGGATTTTVFASSTTSSSTSSVTNNPPLEQTTSITTPPMNPGDVFQGTILLAKSWKGIQITVDNPARVRLYSTINFQNADLSRPRTNAPGLGNQQGTICDMYLDNAPISYEFNPTVTGSNGDSPRTSVFYFTVDNIGSGSNTISISITYIPMQS